MTPPLPLLADRIAAVPVSADDIARWTTVAVVTVVVVVAVGLVAAIALLFRRRAGAQPSSAAGLATLRTTASVLLVRADDALTEAADELGFAEAQFGAERTAAFAAAVADARSRLADAFRLQQALDDSVPDSAQRQREWALQIGALCEAAMAALREHDRGFSALRSVEADAPARITALRARIDLASERLAPLAVDLSHLAAAYAPALVQPQLSAVIDAQQAIAQAQESMDDAALRLTPGGVNTVADLLRGAEEHLRRATARMDAVQRLSSHLAAASSARDALLDASLADLDEARAQRDAAPDAESGAAIIRAMAAVERVRARVAAGVEPRHPIAELDELSAAVAALDTALASARNQAQRLEHARTALTGTLVSATSQITALRALVAAGGRRVGAEARTRLAEAERQLLLAEAEADPVDALDAARRAVTLARDGDALVHYDAMTNGR